MEKNTWDEKYSLGIPSLDIQHERLFSMCGEILKLLKNGNEMEKVEKLMERLFLICITHFDSEEKLMLNIYYPELKRHRSLHIDLVNRIADLNEKIKKTRRIPEEEIEEIADRLLWEHITKADRRYAPFWKRYQGAA